MNRIALCLIFFTFSTFVFSEDSLLKLEEGLNLSEWREYDIDGVTLRSNASKIKVTQLAKKLRRFIALTEEINSESSFRDPRPVDIYLFSTYQQFSLFTHSELIKRQTVGYAVPTPDRHILALSYEWPNKASTFLFHEFMHFIQFKKNLNVPAWFREGEAEFFSTASLREGVATIGAKPEGVGSYPIESLPLEMLLSVEHTNDLKIEDLNRFYTDSWAFVHYLKMFRTTDSPRRIVQADKYIKLVNNGGDIRHSFELAFEKTIEEIELEYQAYRDIFFDSTKTYPLFQIEFEEDDYYYPGVSLQELEIAQNLGDYALLLGENKFNLASGLFNYILSNKPEADNAIIGMSAVEMYRGDLEEAGALLARVETDSLKSLIFQGHLAMLRYEMLGEDADSKLLNERLLEARAYYLKATEVDPSYLISWIYLGSTYRVGDSSEVSLGIDALNKAAKLSPLTPIIYFYLGELNFKTRNYKVAKSYFETVLILDHDNILSEEVSALLSALEEWL